MTKDGSFQGGKKLPDKKLGWVSLNRHGGHPGGTASLCAIRRWIADRNCRVVVNCVTVHSREEGDGVRCRIVSPGRGVLNDSRAHNSTATAVLDEFEIKAGEHIDFVIDCRTNENHDSFKSAIIVTQSVGDSAQRIWNSEIDFGDGPVAPKLSAWAQLAQALLLTNEFAFVD